jgi:hypothetical protein
MCGGLVSFFCACTSPPSNGAESDSGDTGEPEWPLECSLECADGGCECGNGRCEVGEYCDDANRKDDDGCDSDCVPSQVVKLAKGGGRSVVLVMSRTGNAYSWGRHSENVQLLGQATTEDIGDDPGELPRPPLLAGGTVSDIWMGSTHACLRLHGEEHPRCWGRSVPGETLFGDGVGDMPAPDVDFGAPLKSLTLGTGMASCAVTIDGTVGCWGQNSPEGVLGTGGEAAWGLSPSAWPPKEIITDPLGTPERVITGSRNTCLLYEEGFVTCWGFGPNLIDFGGIPPFPDIGDDPGEMPGVKFTSDDGSRIVDVAINFDTVFLAREDGKIRSTGANAWWDGEWVDVGGPVVQMDADYEGLCTLDARGDVRCFGRQANLGFAPLTGDHLDLPGTVIPIGTPVKQVELYGDNVTCALTIRGAVRCWGRGAFGISGWPERINDGNGWGHWDAWSWGDVPVFVPTEPDRD